MKKILLSLSLASLFASGCSSANTVIFGKKTPIEKYESVLKDDGLGNTAEGRRWLAVSKTALQHPVTIQLPYRQSGLFSTERQQALGLRFTAKAGQRLHFNLVKTDTVSFPLYAELYKQELSGEPKLLQAIDTNTADFDHDVAESGDYVLKLQPQLFRAGAYSLSVSIGPSLGFPVADKKAYIGSIWGDSRDGGKRPHEGVDIFAPKRTPAVAATDGFVTGVREGGIGGKVVWLRPEDQNISLYYAHLDEQWVTEGQTVRKGDTVGLVGNTGNAQFTPSHLHFGVYTTGGAIDPLPYVNRTIKTASAPAQRKLNTTLRTVKEFAVAGFVVQKNTLLIPVAVTAKTYLAETYYGRVIELPFNVVGEAAIIPKKAIVRSAA